MKLASVCICLVFILVSFSQSGVYHIPITNPVYSFLMHFEAKGFLPHFSTSQLPLQQKEVVECLKLIRAQEQKLSDLEKKVLARFEQEFTNFSEQRAVILYSESDTTQLLFRNLFSEKEKYLYHYSDSLNSVSVEPLGSIEAIFSTGNNKQTNVELGNLGIRFYGTLTNNFGYFLQATNGVLIGGERNLAFEEKRLKQNVKFRDLGSDFDFSESHIRYDNKWFYLIIGRETEFLGSGFTNRIFNSDNCLPYDAVSVGARFRGFEYRFKYGSLIGQSKNGINVGFNADIPPKYIAMHRFALKPSWGEIAFWEAVIYSGRNIDLAYLSPLSFFKNLEHSLRDRDNSLMGGDLTIRPFAGFQIKASFLLDDIIFSEIGKNYWSNKTASNLTLMYVLPIGGMLVGEYARVEPYTFSHFNVQNSFTNDKFIIGSYLLPNSDEFSFAYSFLWGERYPLVLRIAHTRHGENIYDEEGNLVKNVGADPLQSIRPEDSQKVYFLDGNRIDATSLELTVGCELFRNFSVNVGYKLVRQSNETRNYFRLLLRWGDF